MMNPPGALRIPTTPWGISMTTSSSSSSRPTRDGATTAAILSLGKQIAATLDEHDLLSQWMAHYLAERMVTVESLNGQERATAEDKVADYILRLWEHRHGAALREDPIALSDSVERAITRLDPERLKPWGYYNTFEEEAGPSEVEIEVNTLLRAALGLDQIMADLVRALVTCASMTAAEKDKKWVVSSRAAGEDPLKYIQRLYKSEELEDSGQTPVAAERAKIVMRSRAVIELLQTVIGEVTESPPPEGQ